jgi:hypothetical protein
MVHKFDQRHANQALRLLARYVQPSIKSQSVSGSVFANRMIRRCCVSVARRGCTCESHLGTYRCENVFDTGCLQGEPYLNSPTRSHIELTPPETLEPAP